MLKEVVDEQKHSDQGQYNDHIDNMVAKANHELQFKECYDCNFKEVPSE